MPQAIIGDFNWAAVAQFETALTERICHSLPALDVGAATPIETFVEPGAMVYDSCCLSVPVWLST